MNHTMKKVMAVCLLGAVACTAFGCSKKTSEQDMAVETISLEQTKQDLTFDFSTKGDSANVEDATEAKENADPTDAPDAAGETAAQEYEEVTQVQNVTDEEGHGVTDAKGESATEYVVVGTRPVQNQNQNQTQTTQAGNQGQAGNAPQSSYTPSYDTCKAYWLDMTQQGDYNFNGEFLTITFELKTDIPDGSYPVSISKTDIASWDLVRYDPVIVDGEIAVGSTAAAQNDISADDFCLKVNSESAKQGETVTMTIDLANNPGFCGFVIDIQYDANAMSIIEAQGGKDFDSAVHLAG